MGKVYQSVRGVVQGTLHRSKSDSMPSARAKGNDGSLNDAMEELEKTFLDGIGRLKEAASVASEAEHAEQIIDGLKANITVLEAKVSETEETVHRKEIASQKMEETLSTEIRDLQRVVKQKEEALESRDSEANDLKSKIDVLVAQVTRLELAIEQAKEEAASEAQHAKQVVEGLRLKIATLQAQFTETEQIGGEAGGVDQDRDRQVNNLNEELELQTTGINEIASFSSKAEGLVDMQAQAIGTGEPSKTDEEKPATAHFQAPGVTSSVTGAPRETVAQDTFDHIIAEFSELANVIGSIASLIVRHRVRVLGESMEDFPQARLTELIESLSREISDDKLKTDFSERFSKA